MPADFALLGGPQVPMSPGVNTLRGFDPVGATKAAYDIAGKTMENREQERLLSEADTDRKFLQEAQSTGKYNLADPEGLASLTKDYGPKLSPSMNMKLSQMTSAAREKDALYRQHLSTLQKDAIAMLKENEEATMPFVGQVLQTYEKVRAAKGSQTADEAYKTGISHLTTMLSGVTLPNGQPRFSPEMVQRVTQMSPEELNQFYKGSAYRKRLIDVALDEQRMKEAEARTDALKNPQGWDQYSSGTGQFRENKKAGVTQMLDKDTGSWVEVKALPPDAKPIGKATGGKSQLAKLIYDRESMKAEGKWTPEMEKMFDGAIQKVTGYSGDADALEEMTPAEREWLVEFGANGGRIPNVPIGMGQASTKARKELIKDFVRLGIASGVPAGQVATEDLMRKATSESLKRLTTQDGVMQAAEQTVMKAMDNAVDELKKIDKNAWISNSPFVRKYQNKGMTEILGSEEWTKLNQYMTEVVEGMAKVYSNQTGAGSPPVAYLELANKAVNPNQNLGQFVESVEAMKALITNRRQATKEVLRGMQRGVVSSIKSTGGGALTKPGATTESGPPSQTVLDDRAKRYMEIYLPQTTNKELNPEERKEAIAKARKEYEEITRMGGKVPEPPKEEATAPAPTGKKNYSTLWK